ncbi:MAG: DUF427 domain-containing protein [Trueperaceae bacterium]|nr:DUF427 domain-containing protein [Trueperaceae bacterium]
MPQVSYRGTSVARSDAVERVEGTTYFPRADVEMGLLEPSATAYTCPWKGDAQYYHLRIGDTQLEDAAWSYPEPKPAARAIAGHIAFDPGQDLEIG